MDNFMTGATAVAVRVPTGLSQPVLSAGRHRAIALVTRREPSGVSADMALRLLRRMVVPEAQIEGVDWHLSDRAQAEDVIRARAFVLVLPPIGNLDNPFYRVHPRRNDRFIAAHGALRALYPEVDFAVFAFTGQLLSTLVMTDAERYHEVRCVLEEQWMRRMGLLLDNLPPRGVMIDVAAASWLVRPQIPAATFHHRRIGVDPRDLWPGAHDLARGLRQIQAI